jgi:hypothetical protein
VKTYSFIDKELQDFIRYSDSNEVIKIQADNSSNAGYMMFMSVRSTETTWTNTGTSTWCWDDME